ncbi:MAG TPA: PqqD family protein [Blastocatellia bacterium]|nr:PqqD family protein [Blastocatellia bacterium]
MYTEKLIASEQASFTELLENQEGIILDLENLHYYTLNAAAVLLWKELRRETTHTADSLSETLAQAFRISRAQADTDTWSFLAELRQYGLISTAPLTAEDRPANAADLSIAGLLPYQAPQLSLSSSLAQVSLSGGSSATTSTGAISALSSGS